MKTCMIAVIALFISSSALAGELEFKCQLPNATITFTYERLFVDTNSYDSYDREVIANEPGDRANDSGIEMLLTNIKLYLGSPNAGVTVAYNRKTKEATYTIYETTDWATEESVMTETGKCK